MTGFENYAQETTNLEHEIARLGIALGIDWEDAVAARGIAREALAFHLRSDGKPPSIAELTRIQLFGLAQLMLKVMTDSARQNIRSHGGPAWKAFARALWAEAEAQGLVTERRKAPRDD